MNIPAELVIIANTCDNWGLRNEADMLTHIAQVLMEEQRANRTTDESQRQMPWERNADETWNNQESFKSPMDQALGR